MFYLESENGLAEYAAEDCLNTLATVLGPNILRKLINLSSSVLSNQSIIQSEAEFKEF